MDTFDSLIGTGVKERCAAWFVRHQTPEQIIQLGKCTDWDTFSRLIDEYDVREEVAGLIGTWIPASVLKGSDNSWEHLKDLPLIGADFGSQYMSGANFGNCDVSGANFGCADLREADFSDADASDCSFRCARLSGSSFYGASMYRSDFSGANLSGSDLRDTEFIGAIFKEADLTDTVLDPKNTPNQKHLGSFERAADGRYLGYRTLRPWWIPGPAYEVGQVYKAPVFSTCELSTCHPGLHLCPDVDAILAYLWSASSGGEAIQVSFRPEDLHHSGIQPLAGFRVREFKVERMVTPEELSAARMRRWNDLTKSC